MKPTVNIHWKDWCWSWSYNTFATWWEELTHWKKPWWWERLKVGGKEDDRGQEGWMVSPTQWTWVWANSGRWLRTKKPGVPQSMGRKESDMTEWLNNNKVTSILSNSLWPYERLLLNHANTPGFLAPGGEEFNPGPETRLDRSELLCNKVLLKYKGDRESFWHRHQKGAERVPPC